MTTSSLHRVTARILLTLCACLAPVLTASAQRAPLPTGVRSVVLQDSVGLRVTIGAGQKRVVGLGGLRAPAKVYVAPGYRATFCESAAKSAKCRRLVGWSGSAAQEFLPPYSAPGTVVSVEKALFGYADLHAHPATHLAWGARGAKGPLWGHPGMKLGGAPGVGTDLQHCTSDNHTGSVPSPLVQAARIGLLMERGKGPHGSFGAPLFTDWPAAHDILHQQMHVTMLRRAYEGGLRLMVASATDNQMLDIIWNPEFSLSQGRFALREDADYKAAVEQFEFIKKFVNANKTWLAIARTPTEARAAISNNKLALVFGLELDELSVEEILALKKQYGVALVTPVHLINNSFGGAAAYETFFNVANYVMNGALFGTVDDDTIGFRFPGVSSVYTSIPIVGGMLGPIPGRLAEYAATPPGSGHRNRLGIRDEYGLRRLMKAGLLIDVAHMSSESTDDTLAIALRQGGPRVPLVYSHGGLRGSELWGDSDKQSERGLTVGQLQGLADSGGILGLGTGEDESVAPPPPIGQWLDRYLDVERNGNGAIALGTDLNGMARQIPESERALVYPSEAIRNADWRSAGRTAPLAQFMLGPAKVYDFRRDGIAHIGMLPDFLSVVRNEAESRDRIPLRGRDPHTRRLDQVFHSAHDFIASWEQAVRAAPSVDVSLPQVAPATLRLTLETGTDDLKCGHVHVTAMAGSKMASVPHPITSGQRPHSTYRADLPVFPGTSLRAITKLKIQYLKGQCDPFDTGDRWNIKTMTLTYDVTSAGTQHQGVLIHKRGAPAKKLDRGTTWTVPVER